MRRCVLTVAVLGAVLLAGQISGLADFGMESQLVAYGTRNAHWGWGYGLGTMTSLGCSFIGGGVSMVATPIAGIGVGLGCSAVMGA